MRTMCSTDCFAQDLRGRVSRTILAPRAREERANTNDETEDGYSTCVASKAASSRYGVAKSANFVAVKIRFATRDVGAALDLIRQDIVNKGLQKKAVITLSWGHFNRRGGTIPDYYDTFADSAEEIIRDLDVPLVLSAGNHAREQNRANIDQYPQVFSNDGSRPFINVGSVRPNGVRSGFSQAGDKLTVSAVGDRVTCSTGTGTGSQSQRGTSFGESRPRMVVWLMYWTNIIYTAAPQVAGLLAYFLGLETVPFDTTTGSLVKKAREFLKGPASWSRAEGGPRVAYNLIDSQQNPPSASAKSKTKLSKLDKRAVVVAESYLIYGWGGGERCEIGLLRADAQGLRRTRCSSILYTVVSLKIPQSTVSLRRWSTLRYQLNRKYAYLRFCRV